MGGECMIDYKKWHDRVGKIYWHLCRKYGFTINKDYWEYEIAESH